MSLNPSEPPCTLEAHKLSYSYRRRSALTEVSFKLNRGVVFLVGANGAGKTTLLKLLAGELRPPASAFVAPTVGISYLPQSPQLCKTMLSREFVAYCGWLQGLSSREAKSAAHQALRWSSSAVTFENNVSSDYQNLLGAALNNWSSQTVMSYVNNSVNSDFTIIDGGYGSTGWDGITIYSCSGGRFAKGMLVRINRTYTNGYSGPKTRSVIAHELGHVAGLDHHSTSGCQGRPIMYPTTPGRYDSCGIVGARAEDIAGVASIY